MSLDYCDPFIKDNMFNGEFGIEIESLRVDENGFIAHTKHPFACSPNIDRDFCESQVEFITNVCYSVDELYSEIEKLHYTVVSKLKSLDSGQEFLWPFSNPPYVKDEADIPIASYSGELKSNEIYRRYLAKKYGKKKMLFSGIHFNFSFPDDLLDEGFRQSDYDSYKEYKNQIYLELAKKITQYSWLLTQVLHRSSLMYIMTNYLWRSTLSLSLNR